MPRTPGRTRSPPSSARSWRTTPRGPTVAMTSSASWAAPTTRAHKNPPADRGTIRPDASGHQPVQHAAAYLAGALLLTGIGADRDEAAGERRHGPLQGPKLALGGSDLRWRPRLRLGA